MSPHSSHPAVDEVGLPVMDSVSAADLERLSQRVEEPDDQVFRVLDMHSRSNGDQREHPVVHAMVVIVSDQQDEKDQSGELVTQLLIEENFVVDALVHVESRKSAIRKAIQTAVVGGADLVVTVGGTGMGARDKTPEATNAELDRKVPGLAQALRTSGLAANCLEAGLSRGIAGISGSTLVVNVANSRAAIRDGMATLCPLARWVIADMAR